MYEAFFGLRDRPFELTPNPRYLLLTPKHREALSSLQYGISGRQGITLLLGEAGTGKTSLIAAAMAAERERSPRIAHLANPSLTRDEFFDLLASEFGLSSSAGASKSRFLIELQTLVHERRQRGEVSVLIIDEAQSLSDALLEEVRLLANLETATEKLLPVILAGQPELGDRLNQPQLRQLKQRVALRCALTPLDIREVAAYIATRIRAAGGDASGVFTREAVAAVAEASGGIPRTINVICDNALLSGFALDQRPVDAGLIREVCRDFDLRRPASRTEPEPAPVAAAPPPKQPRAAAAEPAAADRPMFLHFAPKRRLSFFSF